VASLFAGGAPWWDKTFSSAQQNAGSLLRCNGGRKARNWLGTILASKCGDDHAAYVIRHSKITGWRKQCGTPPACDPEIFTLVQSSVEACNKLLDEECERIRLLLALPPMKAQVNKKPEKTRRLDCGQSLRRRQTP
jgi:hypothetical protein